MSYSLPELSVETRAFINGEYLYPVNGSVLEKISPVNGQPIPHLSACDQADLELAYAAAEQAFREKSWRQHSLETRKQILLHWADLIEQQLENLAQLDTLETGRALKNFREDSIPKGLAALRWFAESADKTLEHFARPSAYNMAFMAREPLGVVGLITPWNDPLVVLMWKLAPALLMGNSVILKPAEQASYSSLKIAQLALQAGIPAGVLNVLPGKGEVIGQAIARHMGIRGVFFTGSSAVGKQIIQYAGSSNMKKVGLECGGKSAFLVTRNCRDLKAAARTLAQNMFYNQGQICSAPSRLIIDKAIQDTFLEMLLKATEEYQPGDPFAAETYVGAMVSQEQYLKVRGFMARALNAGAHKLTPDLEAPPVEGGFYLAPSIFTQVAPQSELAQEEVFGPVLAVMSYDTLSQGLILANQTRYGLAAAVWSHDLDEALFCAQELQAGIVHVNSYGEDTNAIPFGGIKESGIGKDKSLLAFDEYSVLKSTWVQFQPERLEL